MLKASVNKNGIKYQIMEVFPLFDIQQLIEEHDDLKVAQKRLKRLKAKDQRIFVTYEIFECKSKERLDAEKEIEDLLKFNSIQPII